MTTIARAALLLSILASLAPLAPPASAQTAAPTTAPAAATQFVQSLSLRPERFIVDSSAPTIIWLSQLHSIAFAPASTLKIQLSLAPQAANSAPIKSLGTHDIYTRNLIDKPFAASIDLDGVADGNYRVVAQLLDGDAPLGSLEKPILIASGIDASYPDVKRRLAAITGHDSAKASVLYPYDLARVINIGQRNWNAFDLGLNTAGQPNYYDFPAEMQHSEELLKSLEAGNDPIWQAKGSHERHYYFAEAGEIMPYRMYVPTTWDGKSPLPFIFVLHGNTRNQDFYFDRDGQILPKLAEQHGYMVVAAFGYHPNGGYNATPQGYRTIPSPSLAAPLAGRVSPPSALPSQTAPPSARGGPSQFANDTPRSRIGELSELDVMHVLALVRSEYPVDPKRTYLFGYSSGGAGAYYLGPKLAENWAAIAIGAGNTSPNNYSFDRLKNIPVFIFNGDQDTEVRPQVNATMAAAMKDHGIDVEHVEYKGFDHTSAPSAAFSHVFDFFDAHQKK